MAPAGELTRADHPGARAPQRLRPEDGSLSDRRTYYAIWYENRLDGVTTSETLAREGRDAGATVIEFEHEGTVKWGDVPKPWETEQTRLRV